MKSLATILLVASLPVSASSVIIGGMSYHYNRNVHMNEENPSIGFEYNGFSLIYVDKNSIEKHSVQIGYGDSFWDNDYLSVGYRVSVANGYKYGTRFNNGENYYNGMDLGGGIVVMPAIEVDIKTPFQCINLVTQFTPTVAMFGFKINV